MFSSQFSIVQVFSVNAYLCAAVGLPANFLLLWLIHRHTPAPMRAFSLILLQTCLTDIFTIVEQTLIQPLICAQRAGGMLVVVNVGPLVSGWRFPWNLVCFLGVWKLFSTLCKQQFIGQFLYRWLLVTRSHKMRPWVYTVVLSILPIITTVMTAMETDFVATAQSPGLSPESAAPIGISSRETPLYHPMMNVNGFYPKLDQWLRIFWDLLALAIVLGLAFATRRFVRQNLNGPNAARDRDLHSQLNRALILQLAFALVCSYAPNTTFLLVLLFPAALTPPTGLWLLSILPALWFWIPALNPFVTVPVVKSYRLALWKALKKCWALVLPGYSTSTTSTSSIQTTIKLQQRKQYNNANQLTTMKKGAIDLRRPNVDVVTDVASSTGGLHHKQLASASKIAVVKMEMQHRGKF